MSLYYTRQGQPITFEQWMALNKSSEDTGEWNKLRRVAEDTIEADGYTIWVSTVFLGTDMNTITGGPPLIFETMAFDQTAAAKRQKWRSEHGMLSTPPEGADWPHDQECDRYSTEEQALKGHQDTVKAIKAGTWHEVYEY